MEKWLVLFKLVWRCIWEFPQLFCGLIYLLYLKLSNRISYTMYMNNAYFTGIKITVSPDYYFDCLNQSFSFGLLIIESDIHSCNRFIYGRNLQSVLLGPLYIFFIIIPSFICKKIYKKFNWDFDTFYTESTANLLGGPYSKC